MNIVLELNDFRYLGTLCRRGHDWEGTGCSLRWKNPGSCIACHKRDKNFANVKTKKTNVFESLSLEERFWQKVDKKSDSECWEWMAHLDRHGYGQVTANLKNRSAHRFAFAVSAKIDLDSIKGLFVCHKCDNPACCNPSHLFLGTCADNIQDMVNKGRHARGERNSSATLTEKQVIAIYNEATNGETYAAISKKYGVGQCAVRLICTGKNWRHLGLKPLPPRNIRQRSKARPS